jgi:mannose-1-phosphate guanylyltransferase
MLNIQPVILAGGSGTRLWPLSRDMYPKQFLSLLGKDQSMLQQTVERLKNLPCSSPLLICNEEHRFLAAEQMRLAQVLNHNIILEPCGKNTAPAIALAAFTAIQKKTSDGEDPILLVLAADHVIERQDAFEKAVLQAANWASQGKLVTFGIVPESPETGYGYIHRGAELGPDTYRVSQFVEKPSVDVAQTYVGSGEYYWNSGMFMFGAQSYLDALKKHRPDIYDACAAAVDVTQDDLDFVRVKSDLFKQCPSESIDYAVMEKTDNAVVVGMSALWSDVGSWASLWKISEKDERGNVLRGDIIIDGATNNYLYSESGILAVAGIDGLCVVQTKDAVLVVPQTHVQEVKKLVAQLKTENRSETQFHCKVYRPWGHYESIDIGNGYQVKRITVNPNAKLSSQKHHHRAEHWIVVTGTARVTLDGVETLLCANQSIYVPLGAVHRLENPGLIPLELIEVQSGSYLGEDDIVRFDDVYGRS